MNATAIRRTYRPLSRSGAAAVAFRRLAADSATSLWHK